MYERFYSLKSRPFQLMPDPRLLFESRTHTRALSYLIYGMERREGFVVITGDIGTGKTLLLQTLLGQLQTRHMSVARIATANLDAEAVIASVAGAFGVSFKGQSKFELMDALVARLAGGRGRGSLLIVDEAQTCTVEALEELRAISNLQAGGQALIQVVLVGQTELRQMLAGPQMSHLRQRIVASHHLLPLDADEISGYIEHRLTRAGWQKDQLEFGLDVYERVLDWSGGIPRRINLLMDRFLVFGFLEEKRILLLEDLEIVIGEFEDEFGHDDLLVDLPSNDVEPRPDEGDGQVRALNERIVALEHALRTAHGNEKAAALLARHEPHVDREALIGAMLRIDRLERAMADADPSGQTYAELTRSAVKANSETAADTKTPEKTEPNRAKAQTEPAEAVKPPARPTPRPPEPEADMTEFEVEAPESGGPAENQGDDDSAADIINSGIARPSRSNDSSGPASRPHFFGWGRRND